MVRDEYIREVRALALVDSQTYELQIDLGFGVLHYHVVTVRHPILEALASEHVDLLRGIFGNGASVPLPRKRVHVQILDRPRDGMPTSARLFINDEPLEHAVARALAARQGEVAL